MKEETFTFRFPIPREIMLNANQSLHFLVKGFCAKSLRDMACDLGTETCSLVFDKYTVNVNVYPPSKRRIDPPNLYPTVKHLVDGLTDAGVWTDDDWTHMSSMKFMYGGLSKLTDSFIIDLIVTGEVIEK